MVQSSYDYSPLFLAVRTIINEFDYFDLLRLGVLYGADNIDEFDGEVDDITQALRRDGAISAATLNAIWQRWFENDLDPDLSIVTAVAARLSALPQIGEAG